MGLFSKKQEWRSVVEYYKIEDKLYKFHRGKYIGKGDNELTPTEFFNAYGLDVCEFDIAEGDFARWDATYHFSLNDDDFPYDMSKAELVDKDDLEDAISQLESDFQKKFNDFELNDTLYTYNKDHYGTFPPVAKVIKKLVNKQEENIANKFILELEILNGQEGAVKRVFVKFVDFLNDYDAGCPIEVIDSIDMYETTFEDYFSNLGIL